MSSADYSVLGQVAPTGTSNTDLLTVATGKRVVVSSITVANIGGNAGKKYDILIRPGGATAANAHYLAKNVQLDAGRNEAYTLGVTLTATDVVTVKTDTANEFAFQIFGAVITP